MILINMDYASIYRQMSDEHDTVLYYLHKYEKQAFKQFKQSDVPCLYSKEITLPKSGNKYLLYYYMLNEQEKLHGSCTFGNVLLLNDDRGQINAIRLMKVREARNETIKNQDTLHFFTAHFFRRYRERFTAFGNQSTLDLIGTFCGRNLGYLHQLNYNDIVKEKNRQEDGAAWGIDDGFILGQSEWVDMDGKKVLVARHRTFLGRYNLKESQEKHTLTQAEMRAELKHHFKF